MKQITSEKECIGKTITSLVDDGKYLVLHFENEYAVYVASADEHDAGYIDIDLSDEKLDTYRQKNLGIIDQVEYEKIRIAERKKQKEQETQHELTEYKRLSAKFGDSNE